jgi:hypothetical protein
MRDDSADRKERRRNDPNNLLRDLRDNVLRSDGIRFLCLNERNEMTREQVRAAFIAGYFEASKLYNEPKYASKLAADYVENIPKRNRRWLKRPDKRRNSNDLRRTK